MEVSFTASVTRADDLLALSFDFFNLRLETAGGQGRLVRITPGEPAFFAVRLPAQHIAEESRNDSAITPRAVLANPTRLVFRISDDLDGIGFTLRELLDWAGHTPSITANAEADAPPDRRVLIPVEPGPTETAIELPYRLVLSPDATGGWNHSTETVTHDGVSELWQTRLGVRGPDGVDESQLPGLRAVWSRDFRPGIIGLQLGDDPGLTGSSLDSTVRTGIVGLSSFFGQDVLLLDPVREPLYYMPPALRATHLVLSALGGWTDVRGDWDFPDDPHQIFPNQPVPGSPGLQPRFSVIAWRHVVAQGRDQYVRVVSRGSLFPLGHRADRIDVFERRLASDGVADVLIHTGSTVVVREHVRDYAALSAEHPENHRLPLRRATIGTQETPWENQPADRHSSFVVSNADGSPMRFHVVGEDWAGQRVDLHMPLVFVPADHWDDPQAFYAPVNEVRLEGQQVNLAPSDTGSTRLPVHSLTFAAVPASTFLPYVESARVSIPAIDQLVGTVAPNPSQLAVELVDPTVTSGDVFLRLLGDSLPVNLPPERAGGLARPSVAVGALSRSLGAMPAGLEDLASIKSRMFANLDAAKLLGTISLCDVIATIAGLDQLPQLHRQETPTGVDVTFEWSPPLQNAGPLQLGPNATLTLSTLLHMPVGREAGQPQSVVHGKLTNFTINFLDVVAVSFAAIEFTAEQGKQMTVRPTGVRLRLQRELEFLNALADILPANGFSNGPSVRITPQGVTAGYALGLPSAGIGIFSLEHVALSASVTLPFDGTPAAVRLAFSERAHPFLATVSMIGGSGFFGLEVDTAGVRRIEGAIEIGANMTVDFAIVAANVHVMAGFYFGLKRVGNRDQIDFSAYLRIGGSVELLGIAGISIDINLSMTLELDGDRPVSIGGRASVVVSVHLLMFRKSLSLSTEKHFAIAPNDPSFDELVTQDDWETYCRAYA